MTITSPPAEFTRALVEGFAQLLAARVTSLAWDDTQAYRADATGIFIASTPDTPSRCVVLTPYDLSHAAAMQDSEVGLQIKTRSAGPDVRDLWALRDDINTQLLGLWPITLPTGVRIETLTWTSGAPPAQEQAGQRRWIATDNYLTRVWRPSPHRT